MTRSTALVSYETPFAPCGGIAAVMGRLPAALARAAGVPVCVITPFHHRLERTQAIANRLERCGSCDISVGADLVRVDVLRLDADGVPHYFLRPDTTLFFAGNGHPYNVGRNPDELPTALKRDALFFGRAVVQALAVIAPHAAWTLLLQDWEAATTALSLAPQSPHRAFVTLHNSYDSPATPDDLVAFGIDPVRYPGWTVLDRALPCTAQPIFTVSRQFALDFVEEPLHAQVLAPHLQPLLAGRIRGIDNGPFADVVLDDGILAAAGEGDPEPLQTWKQRQRDAFCAALSALSPTQKKPVWGNRRAFLKRARNGRDPWFVLAGRDDPRQKGYDPAVVAVQKLIESGIGAQFLFFPIPGDEGLAGLGFLERLARTFPAQVIALPFVFKEGFFGALRGAAFGVMPSLYEPFGMANEFYANGTLGVGRATGGIVQQVVPVRDLPSFTPSVERRSARWHAPDAQPTGLLYREEDAVSLSAADWEAINAAQYALGKSDADRVATRGGLPLFRGMVQSLKTAICDAEHLAREQPGTCARMLAAGVVHLNRTFSWDRAAREYIAQTTDS